MLSSVNIGGKELQLLANAATPYLFKQTFKADLMKMFVGVSADSDIEEQIGITSILPQMAFIMSKQADGLKPSEFMKLKEDDFYDWLVDYEAMDFAVNASPIIEAYMGNQMTTSNAKKKKD